MRTMESTRSEQGLFESEVFLYVEKATGKLTLIAEVHTDREGCDHVHVTDHEVHVVELRQHSDVLQHTITHQAIELWQSPGELRSQIRIDLMQKVLHEMKEYEAEHCVALLRTARLFRRFLSFMVGTLMVQNTLQTLNAAEQPVSVRMLFVLSSGLTAASCLSSSWLFCWCKCCCGRGLTAHIPRPRCASSKMFHVSRKNFLFISF